MPPGGPRSRTPGSCRACSARRRRPARAIERFEFHRAALGLYDFVYAELCDWYLEMIKPRLYADENEHVAPLALHVLAETLAIAHLVIPFVTEEIWSHLPGADGLLMAQRWPAADASLTDNSAEAELARAIAAVQELRGWRDGIGAPPAALLPARLEAAGYEDTAAHIARLARVEWSQVGGEPVAPSRFPAAPWPRCVDRRRPRRSGAPSTSAAPGSTARSRARRRNSRTNLRREGARRGGPGRARQADAAARGARRAVTWSAGHAEEHLLRLELFGMRFGLERMRRLLTRSARRRSASPRSTSSARTARARPSA